jgi:hypothetical protein
MAALFLLSGLGAPVENQHQMVPTFPANNFKSCVSTAVEMKSQVCTNICNNAEKFACPSACRCMSMGKRALVPVPLSTKALAKIYTTATSFRRLAPKKKAPRSGLKKTEKSVAKYATMGYYAPTWGMASVGQDDANVGVAFSGWNVVETALQESSAIELKGSHYLSLGGSSEQGMFNPDTVAKMGEDCPMIKEAGYEGVVFDVEVTRGGMLLVDNLEEAFKKCKAADLVVMVTTSHTAPTGVSLGDIRLKLIESWVKSDNLDIISPQLYTWGGEEEPEFDSTWPCDNCTFNKYKGSKAQFMPSVVNGDHMKAVKKYFDKLKIPVSGYFQWQPVLSASDQVKADEAAKAEEEYAKEHADDQEEEEEAPEEEDPPEYAEGQSPVELAIKEDQAAGWLTDAEVKAAMKEYKEMHEKGWAVDAK